MVSSKNPLFHTLGNSSLQHSLCRAVPTTESDINTSLVPHLGSAIQSAFPTSENPFRQVKLPFSMPLSMLGSNETSFRFGFLFVGICIGQPFPKCIFTQYAIMCCSIIRRDVRSILIGELDWTGHNDCDDVVIFRAEHKLVLLPNFTLPILSVARVLFEEILLPQVSQILTLLQCILIFFNTFCFLSISSSILYIQFHVLIANAFFVSLLSGSVSSAE